MCRNKFLIGWLTGVHVSSRVFKVIGTISNLFIFLRKNLEDTKTQIKPKPTNKIKTSQQDTTKTTSFHAEKLLRGKKLFILRFFV